VGFPGQAVDCKMEVPLPEHQLSNENLRAPAVELLKCFAPLSRVWVATVLPSDGFPQKLEATVQEVCSL
jgi:hypothetical protein